MKATDEQIMKAFRETIERWEKIVKDPDYFSESNCSLCLLENDTGDEHQRCNSSCPIRNYRGGDHWGCVETPYNTFYNARTEENALVELEFLCEVYVDFLEDKVQGLLDEIGKGLKVEAEAEKKEEWVDVTESLHLSFHKHFSGGYDIHFSPKDDAKNWIGWIYSDGRIELAGGGKICLPNGHYVKHKIEVVDDETFKILKQSD